MERESTLRVHFYSLPSGTEPVREWLRTLPKVDKVRLGIDLWRIQSQWPIGMPHARPLGAGLFEVRTRLDNRIARIIFLVDGDFMVLLHGFIKKTQQTPTDDLRVADRRRRHYEQS